MPNAKEKASTKAKASVKTGAQMMVECLMREEIPVLFGYPGATIAPFYNCLTDAPIRHILTRGEQAAGHAANGWARMTGRPGVCVATSGPGATNLMTAIATAYSDSIPLIAITGQVATHQLGRDVFQEVDTTGAVEPFAKYTFLVQDAGDLARVFREAFYIASTGRKGPVLIDVPVDVQEQTAPFSYPESVSIRGYKPRYDGHPLQTRRVGAAIREAERPLICCGGGVILAGAEREVQLLCEESGIPAVSTMMGIGAFPPEHPLFFGMLGQSGSRTANTAVSESDFLILIGTRAADRAILRPDHLGREKAVVHIDIDTAEIGKNVGTTIPLVGDAGRVARQLRDQMEPGDRADWAGRLRALRLKENMLRREPDSGGVHPGALVRAICGQLPPDGVYVSDVGQNQIWSAGNYTAAGRFITTGGMGTMGFSLPAAIGAKTAAPERLVLAVCGDGAFQMCMSELATVRQHGIPVKVVVVRNGKLGLVRELQQRAFGRETAVDLAGSPDFGKIAEAYGISYDCLETMEEADGKIARLLRDREEPYLLDCVIDPEEDSL